MDKACCPVCRSAGVRASSHPIAESDDILNPTDIRDVFKFPRLKHLERFGSHDAGTHRNRTASWVAGTGIAAMSAVFMRDSAIRATCLAFRAFDLYFQGGSARMTGYLRSDGIGALLISVSFAIL